MASLRAAYEKGRGEKRGSSAKTEEKPERDEVPSPGKEVVEGDGGMAARHADERNTLHRAHKNERMDLHGRHRTAHDDMHKRHEAEHAAINHMDHKALTNLHRKHEAEHHEMAGQHVHEHHQMQHRHHMEIGAMHKRHEDEVMAAQGAEAGAKDQEEKAT